MKNQRIITDEARSVTASLTSKALQKVASEAEKKHGITLQNGYLDCVYWMVSLSRTLFLGRNASQ